MAITLYNIFQFITIGIAVGFLGGFLGVGGGIVMIPLLIFWAFPALHVPPGVAVHLAFGTSLAIIIPTSLSSSYAHSRAGNVTWRIVAALVVTGLPASFFGSTLAAFTSGPLLKTLFGALMVALSCQMFLQKVKAKESQEHAPPRIFSFLFLGLLVGLFSGFFGIGGGTVAVPLMVRFFGISIHRAVGISISFVLFASLVGTLGYILHGWGHPNLPPYSIGYVHGLTWVLAAVPSILFAQWGAQAARKTKPLRLRRAFALLLGIVGIRMLWDSLVVILHP